MIETKVTAAEIMGADEDGLIVRALLPIETAQLVEASAIVAELVGVEPLVARSPALERLTARAGARIKDINGATRMAVQRELTVGSRRGYNLFQLANGVPGDKFRGIRAVITETYKGRADTVARTELALANQEAAGDRYDAGGVTHVSIADGPGCGWKTHDDPDKANGTRRTLKDARAHLLAHPNCRRIMIPILPKPKRGRR